MFKGVKLLDGEQELEAAGVSAGDTLSVVPLRKPTKKSNEEESLPIVSEDLSDDEDKDDMIEKTTSKSDPSSLLFPDMMGGNGGAQMDQLMDQMGGKEGLKSMLKQMGLDGPMTPDKINSLIGQIKGMFTHLFENPELLESSRKQILANPMMMQAYDSMGMGQMIRDGDAFRSQMESMKQMLDNPEILAKAMEGIVDSTTDSAVDDFDQGDL